MFTRIRYVFMLSIASIVLLLMGQCYWLATQYQYSMEKDFDMLQQTCAWAFDTEAELRHDLRPDSLEPTIIGVVPDQDEQDERSMSELLDSMIGLSPDMARSDVEVVNLKGIPKKFHAQAVDQYGLKQFMPIQAATLDSLLRLRGYGGVSHYETRRLADDEAPLYEPRYTMSGGLRRVATVEWTFNPLEREGLRFDVALTAGHTLRSMLWQMAGSLALVALLVACLIYLLRTIVVQRRIDNIRREYMQTMLYEMKMPDTVKAEKPIRLGDTEFLYGQNELRHASDRTIITSRQAEILKMLADEQGHVVLRETILKQIWGDDSMQNSAALNVQVTYLRRALSPDPRLSIHTIVRKGLVLRIEPK